jgi:hexosaminidase
MRSTQQAVNDMGKVLVGWQEILKSEDLGSNALAQYWNPKDKMSLPEKNRIILSPGNHAYLDMQYHEGFPLGLYWAGYVSVQDSYDWDPSTLIPGLLEDQVIGVEAALWTETLRTLEELEQMMFPRLAALAEAGWTAASRREWARFRSRLARHKRMWDLLGVRYFDG